MENHPVETIVMERRVPSRRAVLSAAVATLVAGAGTGVVSVSRAGPAAAAVVRNRVYTISARNTGVSATFPRNEFRGLWTASVVNIDWPSRTGLTVAAQQTELRSILNLAVARNLTTVILQVRPAADRMWVSTLGEPWSKYLTGVQGRSPGYDPLAYAVAQAHARGLALHAWINPFRVSMEAPLSSVIPTHPARTNPTWSFAYGARRYYNPGIPAVRNYIRSVVVDLVRRYDVDGIHFDDYFYPYPIAGVTIPDSAAYAAHRGTFTSVANWRRNNINVFIRDTKAAIRAAKPRVAFGVSPFGIWRNRSSSTLGSATSGLESFSALYADTRRWVKEGWIDYVVPQLYWHQGFAVADYNVLVNWWAAQVAGTRVRLFTGEAAYRVGDPATPAWMDPNELRDHVTKGRAVAAVTGQAFYNTTAVRANKLNAIGILRSARYARPALPVPLTQLSVRRPYKPLIRSAVWDGTGIRLTWTASASGEPARLIAIWRWESTGSVLPNIQSTATYLRAVRAKTGGTQSWLDTGVTRGHFYWFVIQTISQTGTDSGNATAIFVRA